MKKETFEFEKTTIKYLTDKLDNEEKVAMENYLNDKEKRKEFDEYVRLWEESNKIGKQPDINIEEDWQIVRSRMGFDKRTKRISPLKYFSRIAAILVLAFGLVILFKMVLRVSETNNDYFTEYISADEKKLVSLPDGSIITLNRNSKLLISKTFNSDNREVILTGEAYFDVEKNPDVPFKVYAENSIVEVLGTSFNIRSDTSEVIVDVVSGKVAFYNPSTDVKGIRLSKQEEGIYTVTNSKILKSKRWDPNNIAWYTNEIIFDNSDIEYVFTTLARYFNKIPIINAPNYPERFYGKFENGESLEEIIEVLSKTLDTKFDVVLIEDKLIVNYVSVN